jgi:hypothetical protein
VADRLLGWQLDVVAVADDRDDDRLALARLDRLRDLLEGLRRLLVDGHDAVAMKEAGVRSR